MSFYKGFVQKIDGDKLKLARQEAGMTQTEAAKYFHVSINAYIMWERGVSNPNEVVRPAVKKFINKYAS